jgi:very-short-patch-repair endonuclease
MTHSVGEQSFLYYMRLLASDVEEPEEEFRFDPVRRWRFDFAWPEKRVAVEIDGGQWLPNGGRHSRDSDRAKLNRAAVMGWRVLRFSPQELNSNPHDAIQCVREALENQ